jgi:hypothetical protein
MRRDGRAGSAWRRAGGGEDVFTELRRRTLRTEDDCRRLWTAAGDPMALAAAVAMRRDLPRWLTDGLLVLLLPEFAANWARAWRARRRDEIHAGRAWELVKARVLLPRQAPEHFAGRVTWELAPRLAAHVLRHDDESGPHHPAAIRTSYDRVRRALARDRWRFYAAPPRFRRRYLAALRALRLIVERQTSPSPTRPPVTSSSRTVEGRARRRAEFPGGSRPST